MSHTTTTTSGPSPMHDAHERTSWLYLELLERSSVRDSALMFLGALEPYQTHPRALQLYAQYAAALRLRRTSL